MTRNVLTSTHQPGLVKRLLVGAGIGLILITIFLMGVRNADPSWGKLWMIRPLVAVPVAGAGGAFFYHLMADFRRDGGWKAIVVNVICLFAFLVALWIGTVLGLDGTLWN